MVEIKTELQLVPEILPATVMVELADAGKYVKVPAGKEEKEALAIGVKFKGDVFRWLPNDRSLSNLVASWGRDTSKWVGKKIVLWKKDKWAFGAMQTIIYGKPAGD